MVAMAATILARVMKTPAAILFLACCALPKNKRAISRAEVGCGPQNKKYELKTDESQHPAPTPEDGKALIYIVADGHLTSVFGFDEKWEELRGDWDTPAEEAGARQWTKALRAVLDPFSRGMYVNHLSEPSENYVRAAYGPNYGRLVEIKKKYDPTNVLNLNPNIKPS